MKLLLSVVLGLVLVAAACAPAVPPTSKPAMVDVRIGLIPATASAPILVSLENGEFAARGLNVTVQPVTDTAQAMISVASGQLDFGNITLGSAALNAFNRGTDLKVVAAGGADPPGHGSNVPEMIAALSTGAIDAGLLLQPTGAQAVARGIGKILIDDYNPNTQNAVVVANSRFLDQRRDAVTSFLEVYVQAIRRLSDGKLKQDDQVLAAIQKWTNTPPDVTRLGPDPYWPKDGHLLVQSVRDEQDFFMGIKSVDYSQPMDIDKLIDYGPLDTALRNIGG